MESKVTFSCSGLGCCLHHSTSLQITVTSGLERKNVQVLADFSVNSARKRKRPREQEQEERRAARRERGTAALRPVSSVRTN